MVVRLEDIRKGNTQQEEKKVVRLSDIREGNTSQEQNKLVRLTDIRGSSSTSPTESAKDYISSLPMNRIKEMQQPKDEPPIQMPSQRLFPDPSTTYRMDEPRSSKDLLAETRNKLNSGEVQLTDLIQRPNETLGGNLRKVGDTLQNVDAGISNALTFGTLGSYQRRMAENVDNPEMRQYYQQEADRLNTGAAKVGDFVGTTLAGAGAYGLIGNIGRSIAQPLLRTGVRGAAAGATYGAIDEAADLAMDTRQDGANTVGQRLGNVALEAALGGALDVGIDAVGRGIRDLVRGRSNAPTNNVPRATETPSGTVSDNRGINTLPTSRTTQESVPAASSDRRFVRTLEQSGRLSEDVQSGLRNSPTRQYQPITNADTVAKANARIAKSIDEAEAYVLSKGRSDAEQIATGMRLIDELQRSGQTQRAVTIAENLAEKLTNAGQTVQAASIWNRLTPEGALLAAQRKVNAINRESSRLGKPVELTEKNANDIMTAAGAIQRSGTSQDLAARVMDIAERMKKGESVTSDEMQTVSDFVKDLQSFVRPPRQPRPPRTMSDQRVRDRVVSFFDQQEQAAKERLRARGIRISSNPLDVWADYAVIGASKMAKGAVRFADWSQQMISDFGDEVRPYLTKIYDRAVDIFNQDSQRISEQTYSQAERIANNYLKKNESRMAPEDAQFIRDLAQQVSELSGSAQRQASQDLQAIMNGFEKAGVGRKISSLQYISMLLNPVTQVRNIVGNEMLYRLERLMRTIATPIDIAASKVFGKNREITFRSGPFTWENFLAPTRDYWKGLVEGSKAGWRGVNPEGLTTAYDISGQAFRSKLNPVTYLEKTLGAVMKGFDYAAFTRASNQRLREMAYLDALNKGVRGRQNVQEYIERYLSNLDDNVAAIAKEYGKYVTLQDNTILSKGLNSLKRGLNKVTTGGLTSDFGAGSLILPFAKTPANLLNRAIDYSPAGFLKAIYQTGEILLKRNTDLTRADVIQSVTRALMGTGMSGVAWWLADLGVLKGDTPGDKDVRNLERQSGLSQFQVNGSALQRVLSAMVSGNMDDVKEAAKIRPGDTLWQYEWAQPASVPIAIGANISQERQQARRSDEPQSRLNQTVDVVTGGINTLFNTSLLQGLQEAFDFMPNDENKIKSFVTNLAKQVPSMFTPSMVNRINMYLDDAQRESYSNDMWEYLQNQVRSRVPGLSQQLPQRVDTLGQPMTRENNFFDVFLSPSQRSKYKPSETAQFVFDLLSETGDERVAPRTVPRYITGTDRLSGQSVRIDLTPDQFTRYQQIVGQETVRLIDRINPNLPTEKKVERVIDALNKAGEKGRREMRRELGLR